MTTLFLLSFISLGFSLVSGTASVVLWSIDPSRPTEVLSNGGTSWVE